MRKQAELILVLSAVFGLTANLISNAKAAEPGNNESLVSIPFNEYQELNKSIGVDIEKTKEGDTTTITQTLHEEKLADIIKWLQGSGVMNPDITQTAINLMPLSMSSVVSTDIAVASIMETYHIDSAADKLRFIARIKVADDYGNDQMHEIFSFNFKRSIFNKVNWDNFPTANLAKIAQGFHYSKWLMDSMNKELQR